MSVANFSDKGLMTAIRFQPPRAWLCVAALLVAALAGCDRNGGPVRLPVRGRVTGKGAETLSGAISFSPAQGNDGLGATCALQGGLYQFDTSNGPSAGAYDVSIRRNPSKPTSQSSADQGRQEWTFKADVPAAGPYNIDFNLDEP
jgi:hypothetical protein